MANNITPNHLINETSPYLFQHAYNPINWYPWSEEAFKKAKAENKPIFLSIGYFTCHWCHVMEEESFKNEVIAKYLNTHFIAIKVDRETRPDIDAIYMQILQNFTGHGGWPMSIFIDYDKKPFYAGTYFPMPQFSQLLEDINQFYHNFQPQKDLQKQILSDSLMQSITYSKLNDKLIQQAYQNIKKNFDKINGGFSYAPKFPTPHYFDFLINYYQIYKDNEALEMVLFTLKKMAKGGIYDCVGYGFSRYSTDDKWLVPHFEKMLYDNCLLLIVYCKAYIFSNNPFYLTIAKEIANYLLEELHDKNGGFYTAQDADSEGIEGHYYTFTYQEIINILNKDDKEFMDFYNITKEGNFDGRNILNTLHHDKKISEKELSNLRKIKQYRNQRVKPALDNKILSGLNGLAICAFTTLYKVSKEEKYLDIAKQSFNFINQNMIKDNFLFLEANHNTYAFANDYTYLIWGLIELYQASFNPLYLKKAKELNNTFINEFKDEQNGAFFLNGKHHENIINPIKEIYDGALPSYNSVAILNFLKLSTLTNQPHLHSLAVQTLESYFGEIINYPIGYINSLIAFLNIQYSNNLTISFKEDKIDIDYYALPFLTITITKDYKKYPLLNDKNTYYLCEKDTCLPPSNNF